VFIAAFVFYEAFVVEEGTVAAKLVRGISRVAVVTFFAGVISFQMLSGTVQIFVQGVAQTPNNEETKAQHWDFVSQWSLPKTETLGLLVPGLFGYKMDTPQNMMPQFQKWYEGGVYWGGVGRSPELDRYFDSGSKGVEPSGPGITMRFTGGGNYCGILVALTAAWTIAQSFRRLNSPFSSVQKKYIRFWTAVLFGSLLLAWGRFAPFYSHTLYHIPFGVRQSFFSSYRGRR
jgi:hypothetical protein